jgi:tRNA/rRNA methyltransferase
MVHLAPVIILVRPQMAETIGAAARAMSNFGLTDLRLVAPRVGANGGGWPHGKALDMAAGAEHLVRDAKLFDTLPEALADIHIAYASTARPRDMAKRVLTPEAGAAELQGEVSAGRRCAILFGPERTGLENDDLVLADAIITIPTGGDNFSLNLAQAVVVLAYCWHSAGFTPPAESAQPIAEKAALQGFFDQLEHYLDHVDHFRTADKKPLMWRNIQTIFTRTRMSAQEIQSLRGVIRALYMRRGERVE